MTNIPTKNAGFIHKCEPFKHQARVLDNTWRSPYYALYWEMGTGKTKTFLDTAMMLWYDGKIDGVLVLAPKGCYLNWIYEEIPKHMHDDIPIRTAYWGSALRKKEKRRMERIMVCEEEFLDIFCVNTEALSGNRVFDSCKRFLLNHKTLMIIDESTMIKNPKAMRTNNAQRLGRAAEYRRIGSGTPITQNPLDLFAQAQFLEPGILGHRSFVAFRSEFALLERQILGTRQFMKVVGFQNLNVLADRILPWSSRVLKKDCLDLPEKLYERHYVELTQNQQVLYDQIRDEAVAELEQGLLTVATALAAVTKMQQIICGHVKIDDGTTVDIDNHRVDELLTLLKLISDKVIIWCAFQRDVELIIQAINTDNELKQLGYPVHYYGKTSTDDRLEAINKYTMLPQCRWFVGTPATGGKGLTLVAGATVIYYSNTYNLEHRLQSEDRAHRIGQTRKVTYIDLIAANTVDQRIQKALRAKKDLARMVLDREQLSDLLLGPEDDKTLLDD